MNPSGKSRALGLVAEQATRRIPEATRKQRVGEVRNALAGREFDSAAGIAVVENASLLGIVPMERLLAADGSAAVTDIMDADPPTVGPNVAQEVVAWHMVQRGESSIAVVDGEGRFLGLIPPQRIAGLLLTEHDEDLARIGGYLASTKRARSAAEEVVGRRLWHRLPWLLIGLVGVMVSALLIGAFEDQLEAHILLAFFLPGVVYMADAVGTQTETVLIRGLSVGVKPRDVVGREFLSALAIGLIVGAAFFPFALIGWGDAGVALAVSLALFASCSIATLVAMALPTAFQRLGFDPAFGSGPLATVIQDLLSIAVYLAIAVPIAA